MRRYLVLTWRPTDSASEEKILATKEALLSPTEPWDVVYEYPGILAVQREPPAPDRQIHFLTRQRGIVLGELFYRSTLDGSVCPPVSHLNDSETDKVLNTNGLHLVEHYWGSYIAIMTDLRSGSVSLLRDPTATLACYYTNWGNIHVFFSDLEDVTHYIPVHFTVDWLHIATCMVSGLEMSRNCSLNEVEDVPGGELITDSDAGQRRTVLWHPHQFCREGAIQDLRSAENKLRGTVTSVVNSLSNLHSSILVRLSGGLDSSIVTTCLAQRHPKPNATCLNFYIPAANSDDSEYIRIGGTTATQRAKLRRLICSADERKFAGIVARKCGFNLIEKERRASRFDLRRAWNAPLSPRPTNYINFIDEDDATIECIKDLGATCCFTGQGGDTVFYCTLQAIAALDYAFLHPFGRDLIRNIVVTSALSRESVARVVYKVIKHGYMRSTLPPAYDPMSQPHLLNDDTAALISRDYIRHPWLAGATGLCPGKRNHVIGLSTSGLFYAWNHPVERLVPSVHPLTFQPVVETCLQIPTYLLLADGVSRGLARRAFGHQLPSEITQRTVKGLPMRLWRTLVRQNLSLIRDRLLNGILVEKRILDANKLEQYLVDEQPYITVHPAFILCYLGCEAWAAAWT